MLLLTSVAQPDGPFQADVVYLSPPWGGIEYQEECVYDVYRLGGTMNCARLLRAARAITPNVALYLPRNSNLCQVKGCHLNYFLD